MHYITKYLSIVDRNSPRLWDNKEDEKIDGEEL